MRKTTFPVVPQGTAIGFTSLLPPLPHGSERSTSRVGNNLEPGALDRRCWVLLRKLRLLSGFSRSPALLLAVSYRYFPAASGAPKAVRCTGAGETFLLLRFGVPLGRGGLVAPVTGIVAPWAHVPLLPLPIAACDTPAWISPWRKRPRTAPKGRAQW